MNQQISPSLAEITGFPVAVTKPCAAHSHRCTICHHPDRIWIELKFLEWGSPTYIAQEFDLYDRDCIYHHAHATNLFELRRRNILCVHENLLERVERTRITSRGILFALNRLERAVRSGLPNPAEINTTLTRETVLVFDPKSEAEEDDEDDEFYPQEQEEDQAPPQDRKDQLGQPVQPGQPVSSTQSVQSVALVPATHPQPANSDLAVRQHAPAQVPDSKQPPPPESRQFFNNKILNPQSRLQTRLRAQRAYLTTGIDLDKLKPP